MTSLKLFGPSITTSPLPRFFYFTSEFECFELLFLCVSVHNLWPSELTVSARAFTKAFTIVRTGAGWHEHVYPNELRRQVLTTTFNCVWSATDQSKELVPREGQQGQGHALLKTLLRAWVSMVFMGKGAPQWAGTERKYVNKAVHGDHSQCFSIKKFPQFMRNIILIEFSLNISEYYHKNSDMFPFQMSDEDVYKRIRLEKILEFLTVWFISNKISVMKLFPVIVVTTSECLS